MVGGRHQAPGESCGGDKGERQESPPAIPAHPSPPSPPPAPQPSPSCRTWLGSIAPGVSTACGWTDLRGNTESPGVGRGTLAPAEREAAGGLGDLGFQSQPLPPRTPGGPGKGFLEPAPTPAPKHSKSPQTHGGWSCGKFPPLHQVPQSWQKELGMKTERGSRPQDPSLLQGSPHFTVPCAEGWRWARSRLGGRQKIGRTQERLKRVPGGAAPSASRSAGEEAGSWWGRGGRRA